MTNASTLHSATMKTAKYTQIPTAATANLDFTYPNTDASQSINPASYSMIRGSSAWYARRDLQVH